MDGKSGYVRLTIKEYQEMFSELVKLRSRNELLVDGCSANIHTSATTVSEFLQQLPKEQQEIWPIYGYGPTADGMERTLVCMSCRAKKGEPHLESCPYRKADDEVESDEGQLNAPKTYFRTSIAKLKAAKLRAENREAITDLSEQNMQKTTMGCEFTQQLKDLPDLEQNMQDAINLFESYVMITRVLNILFSRKILSPPVKTLEKEFTEQYDSTEQIFGYVLEDICKDIYKLVGENTVIYSKQMNLSCKLIVYNPPMPGNFPRLQLHIEEIKDAS